MDALTKPVVGPRVAGAVVDAAPLVGLELLGTLLSPVTLGVSGVLTSAAAALLVAARDLGVSPGRRLSGTQVEDLYGGAPFAW